MKGRRTAKIFGYALRALVLLFIFAVNGLIVWRVFFSTKLPDSVKNLAVTEQLQNAYREDGKDLVLQYQNQASITKTDQNYGYFSIEKCVFIPAVQQVQIVFRYNDSTLEKLAVDYGLDEVPQKGSDLFDVSIVLTDATGNQTRVHPTSAEFDTTRLYTYALYVFDGVAVEDTTEGVFADVYYREDMNYEKDAYGTLCLYAKGERWVPYKLTAAEKKRLK